MSDAEAIDGHEILNVLSGEANCIPCNAARPPDPGSTARLELEQMSEF
jgi:hypothetical protein